MTTYEIAKMLETVRADYTLRHKFEQVLERTHDYDTLEHRLLKIEADIQSIQSRMARLEAGEALETV